MSMHALPTAPPTTIDVVTAAGSVAVVVAASVLGRETGVLATLSIASYAAVVDLRERRIPDELVLLASVPIVVLAVLGSASSASMALGAIAMAGPLLLIHVVSPAAMGFGDVKIALPLGAALGAIHPLSGLVALCVASALTALIGLGRRRRVLPFGPGLVAGAGAALALSFLTDWLPA